MRQKKIVLFPLILVCCLLLLSACRKPLDKAVLLVREDWSKNVRTGLNDLMASCGKYGTEPAEKPYAVFDFDNTSSIFDVEEQLLIHQLTVMAFAIKPEELDEVLL